MRWTAFFFRGSVGEGTPFRVAVFARIPSDERAGILRRTEANPRPFEIVFKTSLNAPIEKQIEANLVFLRTTLEQYLQLQTVGQGL